MARNQIPEIPKKYYFKIGEVAGLADVKPYVLRYWESEFEWLRPEKTRTNQRVYSRKDVELVLLIGFLLHERRYTIEGARKILVDLKSNWAAGFQTQAAPGKKLKSQAAPGPDVAKLEKELAGLRKLCDKQQRELKTLKSTTKELTRELVRNQDSAKGLAGAVAQELAELLEVVDAEQPRQTIQAHLTD